MTEELDLFLRVARKKPPTQFPLKDNEINGNQAFASVPREPGGETVLFHVAHMGMRGGDDEQAHWCEAHAIGSRVSIFYPTER